MTLRHPDVALARLWRIGHMREGRSPQAAGKQKPAAAGPGRLVSDAYRRRQGAVRQAGSLVFFARSMEAMRISCALALLPQPLILAHLPFSSDL
jgi:hypothetical protein